MLINIWVYYNNAFNVALMIYLMDVLKDKRFYRTLGKNLKEIPLEAKKDFDRIRRTFFEKEINIIGGFVRDSILEVLYNYQFPINDLDILLESSDFEEKIKIFPKENVSRFGGLKFKYDNFSMDIFSLNKIFFLRDNPQLDKNLENVLIGCDLSTSAVGYNLGTGEIYDVGAIKDIHNKEINVNNHAYLEAGPTISRLILHADKMGFKIGKKGIDYIRNNYGSNVDGEIIKFLEYKNVGHLFSLVKGKVDSIMK